MQPLERGGGLPGGLRLCCAALPCAAGVDGTPNESVMDVMVRVRQLLSILETQYLGDTVLIIAPDSYNLSVLQVGSTCCGHAVPGCGTSPAVRWVWGALIGGGQRWRCCLGRRG